MGTLWKGGMSFTVPMLFGLGWTFNFLIGGLSGVFLSDTPSDTSTHRTFFPMAPFHYTILAGPIFALFPPVYPPAPHTTRPPSTHPPPNTPPCPLLHPLHSSLTPP